MIINASRTTSRGIPRELTTERRYIQLKETSWFWKLLPRDVVSSFNTQFQKELVLLNGPVPGPSVKNFHLLYPFGTGIDGRGFLASDANGNLCCLKLYQSGTDVRDVEAEAVRWKTAWSSWYKECSKVRCLTLRGRVALLMPLFYRGTSSPSRLKVEAAALHMASQGLEHTDLMGTRHVRLLRRDSESEDRVIFIDMGQTEDVDKSDAGAVEAAAVRMTDAIFSDSTSIVDN
jgi:hypothetical protein